MSGVHWSTIKPAILSLLTDVAVDQITSAGGVHELLKTPKWNAEWGARRVQFIHPLQKQALYAKVTSCVAVGWDDTAFVELDTGLAVGLPASGITDVFEQTSGLRKFVLNLQSWVLEEDDERWAIAVLERVRTYTDFTSSRARLLAVNVDLTDCGPSRDISKTIDKKVWSIGSMDITLTACVNAVDPIPVGWIERVILTSHEQEADGIDVDANLRMVAEVLPPFP